MSRLCAIASAVPECTVSQQDAARIAASLMRASGRRAKAVDALYMGAGVCERRVVTIDSISETTFFEPPTQACPLGPSTGQRQRLFEARSVGIAHDACKRALRGREFEANDITHLVTVSCTGMGSPGIDHALIVSLDLHATVERTNIGFMGCHAAINGLRIADAIARSSPEAVVLLCCVELCSLHFQYQPKHGAATANALFGDGAAACVVSARGTGPLLAGFGAMVFPGTAEHMRWRIGDHGFEMSLSSAVPALLEREVGPWMKSWLGKDGGRIEHINDWLVHPGGPRIVETVVASLALDPPTEDRARADALGILKRFGNMSSPTILMMLERALARGAGPDIVCLAFGPGLAGEVVRIHSHD